ncbi:MAG: 3-oxoacyl-ACP reductase FabG [Oscillospiraceae bacterium]|nr:3-oxoacyl-ACP reductase FabG [Oscillospiraceae bacterium]MBQ4545374.1 3-oxoacyl-ACP reductase FabG [Oscillospiraceae bacterium]
MSKKVLVTGASRGIGFAVAEAFARNGYTVFATYHNTKNTLTKLSDRLDAEGYTLIPVSCDVSSEESVNAMFSEIGEVDILINNAGIAQFKLLSDITCEDWDSILNVNLKSVFLCSKAASFGMIRNRFGRIINISSVWGVVGASCESHYSASKAGIIGLTRALAKELGPSGITVNCIAPGVIRTEMNAHLSDEDIRVLCEETPLGRIGEPEEIAQAALFFATADFVTGETLSVGGGFGM